MTSDARPRRILTGAALALGAALIGTAVGATPVADAPPASALTADQATRAFDSFVDAFWDPEKQYFFTYSDQVIHPEHAHGPDGGLYTDYWWEAQLWEAVMDRYERAGDAESRAMIDQVFDGFEAAYPAFGENDWNDDIGWWARGSIRAYELTGEQRYLDSAIEKFAFISQYEDDVYGGGIWWKNVDVGDGTRNEKNIATNGTAIQTAVMLYDATGDSAYLDFGIRTFDWLRATFDTRGDGHLYDHVSHDGELADYDWTYNFGGYAGAGLHLTRATGDPQYLDAGVAAVDWAVENLTSSGTFLDEGGNDTGGFKGVLTRNLRALIDLGGQHQYEKVLTLNGSQAANHLTSLGLGGTDWNSPAPEYTGDPATALQSLAAGTAMAVIQQATPDGRDRPVAGTGVYEAENARRDGVDTEALNGDFSGRGYLAGWNAPGSSVAFGVNVARAGEYTLTLRYAAAAGDAERSLLVDGAPVATPAFPATADWTDWQEVTVTVQLPAGYSAVTLAAGDGAQYLGLDVMTVTRC